MTMENKPDPVPPQPGEKDFTVLRFINNQRNPHFELSVVKSVSETKLIMDEELVAVFRGDLRSLLVKPEVKR